MALSFAPGGAQWDHHSYSELRRQVALWEGLNLDEMKGFADADGNPGVRDWDEVHTPLEPWLNSSDVRGFISSSGCKQMAGRLAAILTYHDMSTTDRDKLAALLAGMTHCAEHGCALAWG